MGLTRAMVEHGPGSPRYREVLIPSGDTHIVLSVWEADDTLPRSWSSSPEP